MLQQTQVKTVVPFWERWMHNLPTIRALAQARPQRIHKLWEGLGYYTRVRNLQKAARMIMEKHGGRFPTEFDAVLALPGVGRYTAGAVCSIAFNQPRPILDGNVIRVLTRLFGIQGNARDKIVNQRLWRLAEGLVKQADRNSACSHLNQALMELGALVCTPRQTKCESCPLAKSCWARRNDRVQQLPNLGQRLPQTARRFAAFILERKARFLVRQRLAGVVNAHLWEFPNAEVRPGDTGITSAAREALGLTPRKLERLCTIKHSITRYRITLEVFKAQVGSNGSATSLEGRWLTQVQLRRRPFSSAHGKIVKLLKAC